MTREYMNLDFDWIVSFVRAIEIERSSAGRCPKVIPAAAAVAHRMRPGGKRGKITRSQFVVICVTGARVKHIDAMVVATTEKKIY